MAVLPYLFFNGNCAEAMRFYERTLGGKLDLLPMSEAPADQRPPGISLDIIMHARLVLPDGGVLMASDDPTPAASPEKKGFMISVDLKTAEEARRAFAALTEGGNVVMPMGPTFWSEAFGMGSDRFGTPWMVSVFSAQA